MAIIYNKSLKLTWHCIVDIIQDDFNSNLHMDHNNKEVGAGRNIKVQTSRDFHAIPV